MKSNDICAYCKHYDTHDHKLDKYYDHYCEYCRNDFNVYFEGLDVELVVHGHWEVDEDGNVSCSECGNAGFGNFCPHCGATMEGDI